MNETTEINIEFPFDDGGSVSGFVSVTSLGNNLYRLEETPFAEYATFRDVIEVEKVGDSNFVFKRVAEKSQYKCHEWVFSKSLVESEEFKKVLKRVGDEGGHWEIIFGGMVFIHLPIDSNLDITHEIQNMAA